MKTQVFLLNFGNVQKSQGIFITSEQFQKSWYQVIFSRTEMSSAQTMNWVFL